LVRPLDQLRKIKGRKAGHVDNGDPMITPPVSGGLHPWNIRQLNKAIWCYSCAETPPFRKTGFEIGEFVATDSIDKKIVRLLVQSFGGTGKSATESFELQDVHECSSRRLRSLPLMRRYGLDCGRKPGMSFRVNRPMPDLGTRRIFAKAVAALPVLRRSDWSWNKSSAAVRAYIFQDVFDARRTKCALVATNTCFERVGRQRLVAILTGRSEFKHAAPCFSATASQKRAIGPREALPTAGLRCTPG
jgi:hypothetical protein